MLYCPLFVSARAEWAWNSPMPVSRCCSRQYNSGKSLPAAYIGIMIILIAISLQSCHCWTS